MVKTLKNHLELVYVILWVALSVIHFSLLYFGYGLKMVNALTDSLVFNLIFAVIGTGLWFMVRFSDLRTKSFTELALYHVSGAAVTLLAWMLTGYIILKAIFPGDLSYQAFLRTTLSVRILSGIMLYALLVTFYYLLIYFRELKEKSEREAQLTALLKEAELNMLRSQIRPHFLFNSLNSICSLTMTDPGKAREMVIKLSEFMRYSLNFPDTMMITLEKELYHAGLYLDIEKVRFGERLDFRKKIEPEALAWNVPVMILQPLLENSVKYGVYEASGKSTLRLDAAIENAELVIRVGNSYDPEAVTKKGTGTGLKNVRSRLLNLYGTATLMKINESADYFEVILRIPEHAR